MGRPVHNFCMHISLANFDGLRARMFAEFDQDGYDMYGIRAVAVFITTGVGSTSASTATSPLKCQYNGISRYNGQGRYEQFPNGRYRYATALPLGPL